MTDNSILTNDQIVHKTRRIAYQILENNVNEKEVVLAGICGNGYIFATRIQKILEEISEIKITLCEVSINKKNPREAITTSIDKNAYENKSLVLIDDVLNSGSTLIYGVKHFLEVSLIRFKTAVLVNRNHKKYPVKADFKGISLSTSLKEHIKVEFKKDSAIAYLM
ncbi:phosphoribosyltransferase family protein [Flavicella sp.]|uniref:phosphoribosyltransferase family protein n=1 Tax=Flavicella sp. TaxID=2957742 RepID=UPI00262B1378|nr:phosphoribosyltransferase family protein [Flavicella sp.]MDG1803725.1 phosphoribosyltransferase family protein [Flavicella sp.]